MAPLLEAQFIEKRFGGVHALKNVSVAFNAGEVHALMGENGAGKSTLGKIIAGAIPYDSGEIHVDGNLAPIQTPLDAQKLGISIIFQELDLFPNLTVAENIIIGNLRFKDSLPVSFAEMNEFCKPFLDQVELHVPPNTILGTLPIGHMQLVAIARALSMKARLIVMDESTSSLTDDAVDNLFRLIHKLRESGVGIVYVSHKMDEIFRISDRITVLRDGAYIGTRPAAETNVRELIKMMVGREVSDHSGRTAPPRDEVLLDVDLLCTHKLRDVSFQLRAGEVLGIAGLVGAGRSEIGAALFGLDKVQSGEILVKGRPYHPSQPRTAMQRGIGLLPEDRKLQGLMMQMGVNENASMAVLRRFSWCGFVKIWTERDEAGRIHKQTKLKAANHEVAVSTLSGGNQQKVLLARWLMVDPDVIFLDDPTRGVDVGAKQDIYGIIEELALKGKGVIFVSSELPELLRCCDRIMVLQEGRNMGILDAKEATQERIMELATQESMLASTPAVAG